MTSKERLERIAKFGFKITKLGKNIKAQRGIEVHSGSIYKVYTAIFKLNWDKHILNLESQLEIKNEYIKGLETLLYKYMITS